MKKDLPPSSDTSLPDPLNVFAKKIGVRIHLHGDKSKESLKELLMTTLMPNRHQLGCLPLNAIVERCSETNSETKKISEDNSEDDSDKRIDEILKKGFNDSKEKAEEQEDDTRCLCSEVDEVELSFDGKWLRKHLKLPLKMAIKEIVSKKPYDPVSYLGFWLLHYIKCQERNQWLLEKDHELNYLRSMIRQPISEVEEDVSVDKGEEEEETRDWNFKRYETSHILT